MRSLAELDRKYVWHPFTQMKDWVKTDPIVIARGKGAILYDQKGREYIDGNSSIWTNLHGHRHPKIDRAIRAQLTKIAHSSALGLANEPASVLAAELVKAAGGRLKKVFYSDDGSTAMEAALKMAFEYTRRTTSHQPRFLSLENGYHGDTIGAVSLGQVPLFHRAFKPLLFPVDKVAAPYCYRCPFNKARPERADARLWARCNQECVGLVEKKFARAAKERRPITSFFLEPVMQGAAGMIAHPKGYLREVAAIAQGHGALLICDEVMTGFGRCSTTKLFAHQSEGVKPDLVALAKGLTGGYLPMAATLTSKKVFDAFLGEYESFKTFFHGHSYTANQLGACAGVASLEILRSDRSRRERSRLAGEIASMLEPLWELPFVGDIRQAGLAVGIELVEDWRSRKAFAFEARVGGKVCAALAGEGVLTRAIGNVVVVMPPFCTSGRQIRKIGGALLRALTNVLGLKKL